MKELNSFQIDISADGDRNRKGAVNSESTISLGDEAAQKIKRSERKVYPENKTPPEDVTNGGNKSSTKADENNKNDLPNSNRFTESKNLLQKHSRRVAYDGKYFHS
ncbi:Hypothetical predicted protein [Mytilus galloprovincialis]|uniref:Uncharacterized protein n=1 Tax=Mytilus galloprovincialis TaxID=29158 RepID=A0A8B6GCK0_MYTGA|nr:Hypothetical predicted protein [Mytilus galloprovincialis]